MRRLALVALLAGILAPSLLAPSPALASVPAVSAQAAIMIDGSTGQVLYEKNSRQHMYPASTTKILTAIIAIERGHLDDTVIVSRRAFDQEGTSAYLEVGERRTLEELLYGMMLPSGNDAAMAIAEHIGGRADGFVDLMNEKAKTLGALDSHFVTPSGLHDPDHYTSARDLALIARYALTDPIFARIVSTREYTLPGGAQPRHFVNLNKLLWTYPEAIGIKTGYTPEAGHTLVGAAEHNGRKLIVVLMKGDLQGIYRDAQALFDFGWTAFRPERLVPQGTIAGTVAVQDGAEDIVDVVSGQSLTLLTATDEASGLPSAIKPSELERRVFLPARLEAPLAAGARVGELQLIERGRVLGAVDLVVNHPVAVRTTTRTWRNRLAKLGALTRRVPVAGHLTPAGWGALGLYAVWRTGVGIRRYRRKHLSRRRLGRLHPPGYLPLHRMMRNSGN